MPADVTQRQRRTRQHHLSRAEHNLAVLARLARQVWALKDSDPDIYQAARETYQDAVNTLYRGPEGLDALSLAGFLVGRMTADHSTTTNSPEGHRS